MKHPPPTSDQQLALFPDIHGRDTDEATAAEPGALKRPDRRKDAPSTQELPVSRLYPGPLQARRTFDQMALAALAESISLHGVLQPLLVRPSGESFEIVAGERRWRAATLANLSAVPVVVREMTDDQAALAGAVENLQRQDLGVIDEVDVTVALVARTLDMNVEEAPRRLRALANHPGRHPNDEARLEHLFAQLGARQTWRSFVKNKLGVLGWPAPILSALRSGKLPYSLASVIVGAPREHQEPLLALALEGATRSQLREIVLSFQKDKPVPDIARRVSKALGDNTRLARLDDGRRERAQALLLELATLLDLDP